MEAATEPDLYLETDMLLALKNPLPKEWFGISFSPTSSIDDAAALVEQMLPGWMPTIYSKSATHGPRCVLVSVDYRTQVGENGATMPLAICAALLQALIAKEGEDEAGRRALAPSSALEREETR